MQPLMKLTFLSLIIFSSNSIINQVQCTRASLEKLIPKSLPPLPISTNIFVIPPSSSPSDTAAAPYNDPPYSFSPSSAPISMQDSDGDPKDLPATFKGLFNPFNLKNNQQGQSSWATSLFENPDVKKTCGSTDNPELCLSSLKQFLGQGNGDKKTDTFSLLEMQVKATLQATELALGLSGKKPAQSDNDKDTVKDCKEMYADAKDNLEKVLKAIKSKDIGTINSMLSATISDFGTCDDGAEESGGTSSLVGYGSKLTKLVSNCLSTVSLIKDTGATT
ncbi:pectinesterase inhibitor 10 [Spinacia oleracea]|uniref:Pectinesterase inhibitor 10 n=1 Tax=Spinacia oleracea TaxID=3562 RepID=A0A9R0IQA0_SPIOL|nr:pectinesterase inhibitor 10 [Spinacia oleracea]